MEEDMISQLPDDILISIITHTPTKEAVRTSVLSKSWRNIYKSVPSIYISCRCIRHVKDDCDSELITNGLHRLSQLHSGFIRSFKYRCCINQSHSRAFEESMYSLGLHIEKLDLQFSLSTVFRYFIFPCDLLSRMPSLEYFRLRFCILQPNFSSRCSSLKTLRLSNVEVAPGSIECVLSNCVSLATLLIRHCDLPKKLALRGPQVKCIMIYDWLDHVDEIELCAGNLTAFEFHSTDSADILFEYVPQLQHLYLVSFKYFRTLGKDIMPRLESMHLHLNWQIWLDEGIQLVYKKAFLFNNVKRLELSLDLDCYYSDDLLSLMPFLHSCPILQEFHLELLGYRTCKRRETRVVVHRELKKVDINGFGKECGLVSYILRSAVSLQQLYVSWYSNRYNGFGQWEEAADHYYNEKTIEIEYGRIRAMEPQAASKTVQVMLEKFPRKKCRQLDGIWMGDSS